EDAIAMGEVVLRRGLPGDFDAAVAVWRVASAARRDGRPSSPEQEARVRASLRKPDAFFVVADDAGVVVSMAVGMQGLAHDGAGPPSVGLCFISMVFVAPDRWDEGIGGRTVDAVLAEARSRGYDRAQLWTHADNRRAQRLYVGRGFRRSGREKDDDHGDLIVHYERRLGNERAEEAMRHDPSRSPSSCSVNSSPLPPHDQNEI
ncbi:MAG: GNAT family N-acetyltransferase, partial [Thermomicrobiales bacterium]